MESWLPLLIPLLFLVFFPLLWSGVCLINSLLGWRWLAKHYATDQLPPEQMRRGVSGRVYLDWNAAAPQLVRRSRL